MNRLNRNINFKILRKHLISLGFYKVNQPEHYHYKNTYDIVQQYWWKKGRIKFAFYWNEKKCPMGVAIQLFGIEGTSLHMIKINADHSLDRIRSMVDLYTQLYQKD